MKKFTLFFMSLFLAFGAAVAKDEVKDFSSPEINPADESQQTAVYNIRMKFPKEVVVTGTEVSIDVTNTNTNEVVKITSCAVDEWDSYSVVLSFEKKEVEGKDGIEYQDQHIEKAGTYTYTIPAGLIESKDGADKFAGGTYTFSIVGTFDIADWSPRQSTQVEDIVVTFDREITEVKLPSSGLWVVDNSWRPVVKVSSAVINDDKKSATLVLESPITTPGTYNLDLYQGVFISADAVSNYVSTWFNVIDTAPSFSTNYNDGDRVKELGNLEITFKNVTEFEMVEGKVITAVLPNEVEIVGEIEKQDNKFVVTFEEEFTEEGTYEFIIPAGAFTMDDKENEGKTFSVVLYSFEIIPLEIESVTPEIVGEVDQIETIVITFNQIITLSQENWQQISREITLTCGDEEYTLTYNPSSYSATNKLEYTVNAVWANNAYTCAEPVTIAGEYTLNLSDIVVDYAAEDGVDEWGWLAKVYHVKNHQLDGTYTWTVSGNAAAIENVPVLESKKVIYDLLGRRVERINGAGIYIVNGKKVVIK